MTLRFFLDHQRADGLKRIAIKISCEGKQKTIKTDNYVNHKDWDQKKQKHRFKIVNQYLDSIRDRVAVLRNNAIREGIDASVDYYAGNLSNPKMDQPLSNEQVKDSKVDFIDYFDLYKEKYRNIRANSYLRAIQQIKTNIIDSGIDVSFETMDLNFWMEYQDYLIEKKLTNNTIYKHKKFIRLICQDAIRSGYQVNPEYDRFSVKLYRTKPIWLTWDEVRIIQKASFEGRDQVIIDDFLVRCYTSLRNSDLSVVSENNFRQDKGGWYLTWTVPKTEKIITIPIHPLAIAIFKKYDYRIPQYTLQFKNRRIKTLLRSLKITRIVERVRFSGNKRVVDTQELWRCVSTHTARRTFGRKFMDDIGDINKLCSILGQTDTKTTMIYIGWEDVEIGDSVRKLDF